jgi:hypothetical protein
MADLTKCQDVIVPLAKLRDITVKLAKPSFNQRNSEVIAYGANFQEENS